MFGICYALILNVIPLVILIEYQEINGFYIEIGPSNTLTKANGPYFEFVHELTN